MRFSAVRTKLGVYTGGWEVRPAFTIGKDG